MASEKTMAFKKLNHMQVWKQMAKHNLRPKDLVAPLGVSRQMVNYILYKGGRKYAKKLAKIFGCKESLLLNVEKF